MIATHTLLVDVRPLWSWMDLVVLLQPNDGVIRFFGAFRMSGLRCRFTALVKHDSRYPIDGLGDSDGRSDLGRDDILDE